MGEAMKAVVKLDLELSIVNLRARIRKGKQSLKYHEAALRECESDIRAIPNATAEDLVSILLRIRVARYDTV